VHVDTYERCITEKMVQIKNVSFDKNGAEKTTWQLL
jgi:hypothetical protein